MGRWHLHVVGPLRHESAHGGEVGAWVPLKGIMMKSSDLKKILEFIHTLSSLNLYAIQIF